MWNQPWKLAEGFLIGAGLIVTGLLLQFTVGPIDWNVFSFPANIIVLAVFLFLIGMAFAFRKKVYAFRFLASYLSAIPALCYAVVLTAVMGLTRQVPGTQPSADALGLTRMLSFWPFVLIYVYMAFILGLVTLRHLHHFHWKRDIPFLLNHLGLFIALTCATLGNADMQRLKMLTTIDQVEWRALDADMNLHELPLAIELKKFIMEVYDDGSPKRFASEIQIMTKKGKNFHTTVDVNKPAEVEGWKIYQFGYDTNAGADSRISILELVRDPWLPAVYTGIGMMLLGALSMFILAQRKK